MNKQQAKKKFEFNLPKLEDPQGKAVFTKRSLKDISLKCTDWLDNNIIARVERINEDESVTVSLFIDYTGTYHLDVFLKGKSILESPLAITIPCGELEKQAMPTHEIQLMSSTGGEISLTPVTNTEGLRVDVKRDDITIQVEGGPRGNPLWCTKASASKNSEGNIVLKFAPPLVGHYTLQVLICDHPVLEPHLSFEVLDDGVNPISEAQRVTNPITGEIFSIPIGTLRDKFGRFLGDWAKPNDLLCLMFGPDEFKCKIVYSRDQVLLATHTPTVDGYYKMDVFNPVTNELLLAKPFEVYIGTPELKQQIAYNDQILPCSRDGFVLNLNVLTNYKDQIVPYDDDEISVTFHAGDDDSVIYQGNAATQEGGTLLLTVIPPQHLIGEFHMQCCLRKWPILARPLRFLVS